MPGLKRLTVAAAPKQKATAAPMQLAVVTHPVAAMQQVAAWLSITVARLTVCRCGR